jgi:lipoprotein-anchoring transpeptidase ErfK/SrfK
MLISYPEEQELYRAPRYSITVNTTNRTMSLYKDGKYVKYYPIAIGKPSTPTPKGNFKIINKAHNPGGPFGARWLGLDAPNGDYGIHGTNNPNSIGKAVSNGCVRTYNNNIIDLYNLLPVGTPVRII